MGCGTNAFEGGLSRSDLENVFCAEPFHWSQGLRKVYLPYIVDGKGDDTYEEEVEDYNMGIDYNTDSHLITRKAILRQELACLIVDTM